MESGMHGISAYGMEFAAGWTEIWRATIVVLRSMICYIAIGVPRPDCVAQIIWNLD